jgi:hypothetical protein
MFNMLKRGVRTIFGNAKNFAAFAVSSYDFEVLAHLRLMHRCVLQPRLEAANDMGIVWRRAFYMEIKIPIRISQLTEIELPSWSLDRDFSQQ